MNIKKIHQPRKMIYLTAPTITMPLWVPLRVHVVLRVGQTVDVMMLEGPEKTIRGGVNVSQSKFLVGT
jgi:hypothetical protein